MTVTGDMQYISIHVFMTRKTNKGLKLSLLYIHLVLQLLFIWKKKVKELKTIFIFLSYRLFHSADASLITLITDKMISVSSE